ncbi:hypothetical protein BST61_g8074 [Cercospora zeina]
MPSGINRRVTCKGAGLRQPHAKRRQLFGDARDLPRAMRGIEEGEYPVSKRRTARIAEQNQDLYHNKYYRGRFTSGTIIGWYTHLSLHSDWAERQNKTHLQHQLARKTKRFSKETKARYMTIKQGYISTDWILNEIELNRVRTMYENALTAAEYSHEDEEKERKALWRQQKQEEEEKARLQAVLKALGGGRAAPVPAPVPTSVTPAPPAATVEEDVSKATSGRASRVAADGKRSEFEKTLDGVGK